VLLRLDLETKLSLSLRTDFFRVRPQDKPAALLLVLTRLLKTDEQTIVFAATRHHVEMLHALLRQAGIEATAIYGTLDPAARKIAIGKFRANKAKVRRMACALFRIEAARIPLCFSFLPSVPPQDWQTRPRCRAGHALITAMTRTRSLPPPSLPFRFPIQTSGASRNRRCGPRDRRSSFGQRGPL
jgi:hypothetical protein